jgi:hypothetical protein
MTRRPVYATKERLPRHWNPAQRAAAREWDLPYYNEHGFEAVYPDDLFLPDGEFNPDYNPMIEPATEPAPIPNDDTLTGPPF